MDKSVFDGLKDPEEGVSEVYPGCSGVFQAVPSPKNTVPDADLVRFWYTKQAENGKIDRWRREKVLVFLILLTVTILALYKATDAALTASSIVILAAYSIAADPLHLSHRKLSRYSRYLFGTSMLPILIVIGYPTPRTVLVAGSILAVCTLIAVLANKHWRAAESYEMSRHVLKALQPDDNTDHHDACLTAWQADGAREVVAAAAEMGSLGCTAIEAEVRKAAYTIGFCRASALSSRHAREREEYRRKAAEEKARADALEAYLANVRDYADHYDDYRRRLADAETIARIGAKAETEAAEVKAENRKLLDKIEVLEKANEDLIKTADNPMLAEEIAEERINKRLEEGAKLGLSVRRLADFATVSHRRAQEYLKEYKEKEREKKDGQQN